MKIKYIDILFNNHELSEVIICWVPDVGFLMAQLIHYFLVAQISSIKNVKFAETLWAI